jgi:hypothetical protein
MNTDKPAPPKCRCGVDVTPETGVIYGVVYGDGTAQCHECSMTDHIVATSGIDRWTARMRARRILG